ncbi:uncharacterized protein LOC101739668 isoform X3 [Bombyx mori]
MSNHSRPQRRREWDPMRDDFNEHTYDVQYADDNAGEQVQLDHTKLYIINIPRGLSEDGIRAAFSKHGKVLSARLSKNPNKRFAIVQFETASEAKLAMMKMNGSEPLNLKISIAHKTIRKTQHDNKDRNYSTSRNGHCSRDEASSISSKGWNMRNLDDVMNNDEIDEIDDMIHEDHDDNLDLELDMLTLKQLKIKEEQLMCKRRLLLRHAEKRQVAPHSSAGRSVLPDGRIVVRNNANETDSAEVEPSFAGAGSESLKTPGLERNASRQCVKCGAPADWYCSRCAITPYCSQTCQTKDWTERHKSVCHYLAPLKTAGGFEAEATSSKSLSNSTPMRSSHSPPTKQQRGEADETDNKAKNIQEPRQNYHRPSNSGPNKNIPGKNQDPRRPATSREAIEEETEERGARNSKPAEVTKDKHHPMNPVTFQRRQLKSNPVVDAQPAPREQQQPAAARAPEASPTEQTESARRTLVPDRCLIDSLSEGDVVLVSVELKASECCTKQGGYVCLSMHEKYESDYQKLCEDYVLDCEADSDEYKIITGDTFSYLSPEDGGWYRARALNTTMAALLDGSKVVYLRMNDKVKKLPAKYSGIPEFCCVLNADVEVGLNLKCSLLSKTPNGFKVTLENVETEANVGEGEITRWIPEVDYPPPVKNVPVQRSVEIPEVPRPEIKNKSRVILVDATDVQRVFVRPADTRSQKAFDNILQDVLLYGTTAEPLKEPPSKGQTVVSKYTDNLHYRALCKRTSVNKNKYLLEYIEYGNIEITQLNRLYACPEHLSVTSLASLTSHVQLDTTVGELTPRALEYIETIKEEEMILTLSSGGDTAQSGAALVNLTLVKNNENVNKRIEELCTPEWKKLELKGVDVIETERLMYGTALDYIELPAAPFDLQVLDEVGLDSGNISGCPTNSDYVRYVMTKLPARMREYCESEFGRQPYLPAAEELCIAQLPPSSEWHRAVVLEQILGPGGGTARVLFLDHGNVAEVPVSALRKMLAEFVTDLPAVACQIVIEDFPKQATAEMLSKARRFMSGPDKDRAAQLPVRGCDKQDVGIYTIRVPELLQAMTE